MARKVKLLNRKTIQEKLKLLFMTYADFESVLVPENSGK